MAKSVEEPVEDWAKRPMKAIGKTAWQRLKIRRDDIYEGEAERR